MARTGVSDVDDEVHASALASSDPSLAVPGKIIPKSCASIPDCQQTDQLPEPAHRSGPVLNRLQADPVIGLSFCIRLVAVLALDGTTFPFTTRFEDWPMLDRLTCSQSFFLRTALWCLAALASPLCCAHPNLNPSLYRSLSYRFIGPQGGRIAAVVGIPGNPRVYYLGSSSGGVWKSTDGGVRWKPVFDHEPAQSIGALALDPDHPEVVWAGTGEAFYIRPTTGIGDGIYRSDNGGRTWHHLGLRKTGRIPRIVVDPDNLKRVYVCAAGSGFGPSQHRGIYETRDNGRHWKRIFFVNPLTGCSDLAINPRNPRVLLAGMWQFDIHPWNLASGGPGSGVYLSRNGGRTWTHLVHDGLPATGIGKVAVAISDSNPSIYYALLEEKWFPGLYRSTDSGRHWTLVSRNHSLDERAPYYTRFAISPTNPDRLYFVSTNFLTTRTGGQHVHYERCGCGDNHDIWIDPANPKRMVVTFDEGATITLNGWKSYQEVTLPNAQLYHVATDRDIPFHVFVNRQDGHAYRLPSNTRTPYGVIPPGYWTGLNGCESGFTLPDTRNNNIVWSGCYDGWIERYNIRRGEGRAVSVFPLSGYGWPPRKLPNSWDFVFPLALSPENPKIVYAGSQYVYRTENGGQSWQRISPNLTRNIRSDEGSTGGVSHDNLGTFDAMSLSIIAPSPLNGRMIWTGGYDGTVHLTVDGGLHWMNVTPRGLPPFGTVTSISPSNVDPNRAYLSVDRQLMGDNQPYIYVTNDRGRRWHLITRGIPVSVFSIVHCVKVDPLDPHVLFAGTDNTLYWSPNDGRHWYPLQNNLPHAPIYWVTVQPVANDLVVATYGRGAYILSDLTALTDLSQAIRSGHPVLFPLRTTYRFHTVGRRRSAPNAVAVGHNPPYGAVIDFYLPRPTTAPVRLVIRGPSGRTIRTFSTAPGTRRVDRLRKLHAGINRFVWDLRYAPVRHLSYCPGSGRCPGQLFMPPPHAPWVHVGPKGYRPIEIFDLRRTLSGPLATPGRDTVTLEVGTAHWTEPLLVKKDPYSAGNLKDIRAQVALALKIRNRMDETLSLITKIEWMRLTLSHIEARLRVLGDHPATLAMGEKLSRTLLADEGRLFDVYLTGAREDAFQHPVRILGRLAVLLRAVEHSSDYPPTDADRAVFRVLAGQLTRARARFHAILHHEVQAFNRRLIARGLSAIILVHHT